MLLLLYKNVAFVFLSAAVLPDNIILSGDASVIGVTVFTSYSTLSLATANPDIPTNNPIPTIVFFVFISAYFFFFVFFFVFLFFISILFTFIFLG